MFVNDGYKLNIDLYDMTETVCNRVYQNFSLSFSAGDFGFFLCSNCVFEPGESSLFDRPISARQFQTGRV